MPDKLLHISVDRFICDRDRGSAYTPQCHYYFYVHRINAECSELVAGCIFKNASSGKCSGIKTQRGSDGQLFVFFIMVVAAAEVSVGLAIIVMMYRNIHSVDVNFLNRLKH